MKTLVSISHSAKFPIASRIRFYQSYCAVPSVVITVIVQALGEFIRRNTITSTWITSASSGLNSFYTIFCQKVATQNVATLQSQFLKMRIDIRDA